MINNIPKIFNGFGNKLPVYRQSELAECGLVCLAMVSTYHGHKIDVNGLRQRYPLSLKGTNLRSLMKMASALKISTRALKLPMEVMNKVQCPAILHWDLDHFVVLKSVSKKYITIHDPALGVRKVKWSEVSDHYTGIALELTPQHDLSQLDERVKLSLSSLWSKSKGLVSGVLHILVLSLMFQILVLVVPYFMQLTIDEAVTSLDKDLLLVLALGFIGVTFFRSISFAVRGWLVTHIASILNFQMSNNLFSHLIKLPLSYFEKRHVGDLVSRFSSLDEVNRLLTTGFVEAVVDGVMVVLALAIMYYYSLTLTLIAVGVVLFYMAVRLLLYRLTRNVTEELIVNSAKEDSHFLETARAIQTIKLFSHEAERIAGWQNRYTDQINSNIKLERIRIGYRTVHLLVTGVEHVVLIWLGGLMIIDNEMTIGMLIAFMSYRQQFSDQSQTLVDKIIEYIMLRLHLDRISDIVLEKTEPNLYTERGKLQHVTGKIILEDLGFCYSNDEEFVFRNINLIIEPGEFLAITGASGCGKTTLFKVITGLLKPTEGKVLIDGVNLNDFGLANYRDEIATVMQDDVLLGGSIMDNITLFDQSPDFDKAVNCAVMASIAEDILRMPMGFQTLVGDLGSTLSGGQQQRLYLARALYKNPRILYLDEASSHLDTATEKKINNVLGSMGITRVIIAHRQETINMASRVFNMLLDSDSCEVKKKHSTGLIANPENEVPISA